MNVGDIKRRVTNILGDDAKVVFEDADLLDYINDAQLDICRKTGMLPEFSQVSPISGQENYILPANCIEVLRATYKGAKLYKTTWQEVDMISPMKDTGTSQGAPSHFYVIGNTIYFYPCPVTSEIGTIKLTYSTVPTVLTIDTDVPQIPLAYHEDICLRVIAKGHEQVEDYQASQAKTAEYNAAVSLTQEQSQEGSDESYPVIRDIESQYY
jgi:Family of unknown function (DUF6682)